MSNSHLKTSTIPAAPGWVAFCIDPPDAPKGGQTLERRHIVGWAVGINTSTSEFWSDPIFANEIYQPETEELLAVVSPEGHIQVSRHYAEMRDEIRQVVGTAMDKQR